MSFLYLLCLLFSLFGLAVLDWKYKLAFFCDHIRTIKTLLIGIIVFVVWDLLGIRAGIFFNGDSRFDTGIHIARELPIEEIFFLTLLIYFALILWRGLGKK